VVGVGVVGVRVGAQLAPQQTEEHGELVLEEDALVGDDGRHGVHDPVVVGAWPLLERGGLEREGFVFYQRVLSWQYSVSYQFNNSE